MGADGLAAWADLFLLMNVTKIGDIQAARGRSHRKHNTMAAMMIAQKKAELAARQQNKARLEEELEAEIESIKQLTQVGGRACGG